MAGSTFSFNAIFLRLCLLSVEIQLLLHISCSIDAGFSVDMIHRDSPESPLHDPYSTPFSRLHSAVNRSTFRVNYLRRSRFPDFISSPPGPLRDGLSNSLFNYNFEFLMSFDIGSKGEKAFVGIDTGTDFTWVLCNPCPDCYEHIPTIFDPLSSKTYKKLNCGTHPCTLHSKSSCDSENKCLYVDKYVDGSIAKGILSIETLGFNSVDGKRKFNLHDIIFGCTHETKGNFGKGGIGLVGLNHGALSLISQLGPTFGRRFSYCLPHKINHRSQLFFGAAAIVSGHMVKTTPLFIGSENDYNLMLTSIIVGEEEPIIVSSSQDNQHGNIIIDSGTTFTYLESMQDIIKNVKKYIPLNTKSAPYYDLCFDTSKVTKAYRVPKIIFNFAGDVAFVLSANNAFSHISDTTMCLLIVSSSKSGGHQFFGNRAQLGYHIEYDIDNSKLNFRKNNDCSTKYIHARDS